MLRIPFGKKQAEQAGRWALSLATFGGAGGLGLLYFTDWKLITQFIPFYSGKYEETKDI